MKLNFWTSVTLQVALLFIVGILASLIPEHSRDFFGDYFHQIPIQCRIGIVYEPNEPHWHWGYRHVLWCIMGWAIAMVQVVRIIVYIVQSVELANKLKNDR